MRPWISPAGAYRHGVNIVDYYIDLNAVFNDHLTREDIGDPNIIAAVAEGVWNASIYG